MSGCSYGSFNFHRARRRPTYNTIVPDGIALSSLIIDQTAGNVPPTINLNITYQLHAHRKVTLFRWWRRDKRAAHVIRIWAL